MPTALRQAGVPVMLRRFDGLLHGFCSMATFSPVCDAAVARSLRDLRRLIGAIGNRSYRCPRKRRSGTALSYHVVRRYAVAAATARRASTPTRCARYSALPWMSLAMPSAGMVMPFERLRAEALLERLLERGHAEHAARAGAGHRHADVGAALGHEHADQRKARGRVGELDVGRLVAASGTAP